MNFRIIGIGLIFVSVFAHAADDQREGFTRFLTDKVWAVTEVGDPTGLAPDPIVQRFELRPGDCLSEPPFNDCENSVERAELAQDINPPSSSSDAYWYRWEVFFPEDFKGSYPARNRHGQFIDKATGSAAWVFEIGSTGALWFGSRFDEESRFFSLINERELRGQWHEIIVEGVWNNPDGRINVWVNGEQRARYRGVTCRRCKIFLSYGISRVGVSEFKKRHPEKALPVQVVYYLPVRIQRDDPGWIVTPPPKPAEEGEEALESTVEIQLETAEGAGSNTAERAAVPPEPEKVEDLEEEAHSTVESKGETIQEGVTIVSEGEEQAGEMVETIKAESQAIDPAPEPDGQTVDSGNSDEIDPDTDTETDSMNSQDGSYDKSVNPFPVPDADDRR